METNETPKPEPGTEIAAEQAGEVGGAGSCSATVNIGGVLVDTADTMGDALIGTYEGAVDLTSHVIERVATAVKS